MRNPGFNLKWTACCFCIFLLFSCSSERKTEEVTIGRSVKADVLEVQAVDVPEVRYFPGHVRSKVSITLAAKMPGFVKEVPVQIGDAVRKGDLLVLVDDTDVRARVNALFSAEKSARAQLESVSARYEYSKINFNRFSRLYKEESATKDEFDRARTEYLALKNQVAAIQSDIKRISAQLQEAKNQLSYVKIKAPMDGWVSGRNVDPGTYVNPGVPLISLDGKGSGFWFEADVDEALQDIVKEGEMVTVSVPAAHLDMEAPVVHVQRSSRPQTRTFTVLADLDSADLKSGFFGRMFLQVGSRNAILLPQGAVVKRGGINGVFVVDEGNMARWRIIKAGSTWRKAGSTFLPLLPDVAAQGVPETYVLVLSGLSPGEKIVSSNLSKVSEGSRIE
jgi:RND family efflux transporter MFP subunit